jgi:tellurium resistance protein TerD
MAISLAKGQRVSLEKEAPGLKKVLVGLGWDVNQGISEYDFDLDASVFMVDANGHTADEDFIFYNNRLHSTQSVQYMGDSRTGGNDGDDEQIIVDLETIPDYIQKLAFTVTIYDYENRHQNFGQISNAYIHVQDLVTENDVLRYDLTENFSVETAIIAGELYRHSSGDWRFQAIGPGFKGGLAALCSNYGIETY